MNLLQKIKDMIRRITIKKIEAPKLNNEVIKAQENKYISDNFKFIPQNVPKQLNNIQKLKEIFKLIGCNKKSIDNLIKIDNVDIQNLRKNLYLLNDFNFSNIQLSIIITQNKNLITMKNEELKDKIDTLRNYFIDEGIVKNLIYNNSNIFNKNIEEIIEEKKNIFDTFGISFKSLTSILIENSNVLNIDKNRLINSLHIIRDFCITKENFMEMIKTDPIVIGIQNKKLLEEYI